MTTILLVEDNEWDRNTLARKLARFGYLVQSVTDVQSGIEFARLEHPDLILMDLSLSAMDGWEAARRLKADPFTSSIPLIALTAQSSVSDREEALGLGFDDYEIKPVDLTRLLEKIRLLLPQAVVGGGL
jgi:two-component system cell cycle response regulator DivK